MERQGFVRDVQKPITMNPMLIAMINPVDQKFITASPTPSTEELVAAQLQQVFNPNAVKNLRDRVMENYSENYSRAVKLSFYQRYLGWKPKPKIAAAGLGAFPSVAKGVSSSGGLGGVVPILVPVPAGWTSKFKKKIKISDSTRRADWKADDMLHYVEEGYYADHLADGGDPDPELDAILNQIGLRAVPQEVIRQAVGAGSGMSQEFLDEMVGLTSEQPDEDITKVEEATKKNKQKLKEIEEEIEALESSTPTDPLQAQAISERLEEDRRERDSLKSQISDEEEKIEGGPKTELDKEIERVRENVQIMRDQLDEATAGNIRSAIGNQLKQDEEELESLLKRREREQPSQPSESSEPSEELPPSVRRKSPYRKFQNATAGSGLTREDLKMMWRNKKVKKWFTDLGDDINEKGDIKNKFDKAFPNFGELVERRGAINKGDVEEFFGDPVSPSDPQLGEQLLPDKGGGKNTGVTIDPVSGTAVITGGDKPPPGGGTEIIEIPPDPVGGRTETDQPFPKPPDPTETEEEKRKKDIDEILRRPPKPPPPPPRPDGPITRPIDPRPPVPDGDDDDDDDDDDDEKIKKRSTVDERDKGHGWLRPKFERGGQREALLLSDEEAMREIANWTLFDLPMPVNERMSNPMYRKHLRDMFVRFNGPDGKWRNKKEFKKFHKNKNRAVRRAIKPHLQEFPFFNTRQDKLHGGRFYIPQQPRKRVNSEKNKRYIKSAEPVMLPHYSVERRVGDGFFNQKDMVKRGSVFTKLNPANSRDINKRVEYKERAGLVYPEVGHVMNGNRKKIKPQKINLYLSMK